VHMREVHAAYGRQRAGRNRAQLRYLLVDEHLLMVSIKRDLLNQVRPPSEFRVTYTNYSMIAPSHVTCITFSETIAQ